MGDSSGEHFASVHHKKMSYNSPTMAMIDIKTAKNKQIKKLLHGDEKFFKTQFQLLYDYDVNQKK